MGVIYLLRRYWSGGPFFIIGLLASGDNALAQPGGSPWENAASRLQDTFSGTLARSLAIVAVVLAGLMYMFGESGSKRAIAGVVFGGGLALMAADFLSECAGSRTSHASGCRPAQARTTRSRSRRSCRIGFACEAASRRARP